MSATRVYDDFLSAPEAYRLQALTRGFASVDIGAQTFHGIAETPRHDEVQERIARLGLGDVWLSFFRKSPCGQREPNYVHSDIDMGRWTCIYYMTPEPPENDGTMFWANEHGTGGDWSPEIAQSAATLEGWEPWRRIASAFNRLLVFRSDLYHSRALFENFGEGDDARLIQVAFIK